MFLSFIYFIYGWSSLGGNAALYRRLRGLDECSLNTICISTLQTEIYASRLLFSVEKKTLSSNRHSLHCRTNQQIHNAEAGKVLCEQNKLIRFAIFISQSPTASFEAAISGSRHSAFYPSVCWCVFFGNLELHVARLIRGKAKERPVKVTKDSTRDLLLRKQCTKCGFLIALSLATVYQSPVL